MNGTDPLEALLGRVRACTACQDKGNDLPLGPRPILQAASSARILIVGQAPGRLTHAKGRPFDDPSGERLRAWLGVDREAFYNPANFAIIPMGFCFPGTGKAGDAPPRPECAPLWRQPLLNHLPAIKLTLVLGQFARNWHLGNQSTESLTETVAAWHHHWPGLLPLPHPSPRNLGWFKRNPWFEADILPMLQDRIRGLLATA